MKRFLNHFNPRRVLFLVVVICVVGRLLIGGVHLTRATQTENPDCLQQIRPDCHKYEPGPTCPKPKRSCARDKAK